MPTCTLLAADAFGISALRIELHILHLLHTRGCGSRLIMPLATVRWPGQWYDDPKDRARFYYVVSCCQWKLCTERTAVPSNQQVVLPLLLQPTHGYVMPGYRRGSVAKLLTDICNR